MSVFLGVIMALIWRFFLMGWMLILAGGVEAGQSGQWDGSKLLVTITTEAKAGRPGAFSIGAHLANGKMAFWTNTDGWRDLRGHEFASVDGVYSALPSSVSFTINFGNRLKLCGLTGGKAVDIYAGYGILTAEQEAMVNLWRSRVEGASHLVSIEHARNVLIMDNVVNNPNQYGLVHSDDCNFSNDTN